VEFTSELENQIFPGSEPLRRKTGKIMQGIGNQYGADNISEGRRLKMSDTNACPIENDTIPRKKDRNESIPRLDTSPAIAKYVILDRFDRNHVHSPCHFSDLRARLKKFKVFKNCLRSLSKRSRVIVDLLSNEFQELYCQIPERLSLPTHPPMLLIM
jgi:hypothetical protein